MKKLALGVFALIGGVLALQSNGSALTTTQYTTKPVMVTITITPSPAPVGFAAPRPAQNTVPAGQIAFDPPAPATLADRAPGGMRDARYFVQPEAVFGAAFDPGIQLAQVQSAPAGNIPVNVVVHPDPTAAYLHINQITPNLTAVYGMNTFTCVYQVFANFSKTWKVDDWVYGTATQGGPGSFPGWNYPTAAQVSWIAEGITTSYTPFTNSGAPGQLTFSGVANVSKTVCIDLQVNVTNNIPAGTYSLPVTYALFVTF